MRSVLVTGSSGLIGSEVVAYLARSDWQIHGVDNNMRADCFGPNGDTRWNQSRLQSAFPLFQHHEVDLRSRTSILELVKAVRPAAIVHCAAQPSHDLAASRPFDDFDTNAVGTLNLLEAARQHAPVRNGAAGLAGRRACCVSYALAHPDYQRATIARQKKRTRITLDGLRGFISKEARRVVEAEYGLERQARRYLALYQTLLGASGQKISDPDFIGSTEAVALSDDR